MKKVLNINKYILILWSIILGTYWLRTSIAPIIDTDLDEIIRTIIAGNIIFFSISYLTIYTILEFKKE